MRRDVAAAEGRRRGDHQVAAHRIAPGADRTLDLVELAQQAAALVQELLAQLGEREPARRAVHQLDAEALLQRVEPPPHHHRGDALDQRGSRRSCPSRPPARSCAIRYGDPFAGSPNQGLEHTWKTFRMLIRPITAGKCGELRGLHPLHTIL